VKYIFNDIRSVWRGDELLVRGSELDEEAAAQMIRLGYGVDLVGDEVSDPEDLASPKGHCLKCLEYDELRELARQHGYDETQGRKKDQLIKFLDPLIGQACEDCDD